jgi:hypothetical protein
MEAELLPDCRTHRITSRVFRNGVAWAPIFCANCHVSGPLVPEENCTFAFWLCPSCEGSWGQLAGTMAMPDEVFWEKCKQTQLEVYGRELNQYEVSEALKDGSNPLTKLSKDRP